MADYEFPGGIIDGSWWNIYNSSKSVFPLINSSSSSMITSMAAANNDAGNYITSWKIDGFMDPKHPIRSCEGKVSDHTSLGFHNHHPQLQKPKHSDHNNQSSSSANGGKIMDSTSSNWNNQIHAVFGSHESSFHSVLEEEEEEAASNSQIKSQQVASMNGSTLKLMKPETCCLNQQSDHQLSSASYDDYPYNIEEPSSVPLHHHLLLHPQPQSPQVSQPKHSSLFTNPSLFCAHNSSINGVSPFFKPILPKQTFSGFHRFSNKNNNPFWINNSSPEPPSSPQPQYQSQTSFEPTHNGSTLMTKNKREEVQDLAQGSDGELLYKKPRIESPMPTFKVRKDKLGDRITALQQLVSPFGKTDTASVLHDAFDYIKYLHQQLSILSAPYLNNGVRIKHHQGWCVEIAEGVNEDLNRQGLCLVPLSNTLPIANYEMDALDTNT